jgi:hypothetical protein
MSNWDVSRVTNMDRLFILRSKFNEGASAWDVNSVTIMQRMFNDATSFNQPP